MILARLLIFVLSFLIGILPTSLALPFFQSLLQAQNTKNEEIRPKVKNSHVLKTNRNYLRWGDPTLKGGSGTSYCGSAKSTDSSLLQKGESIRSGATKPFRVTSKIKAQYTELARVSGVEGTVKLRVTFLASGQIGGISVINGLPHGLTEMAIEAARKIEFEPKRVNGAPQSVSRPVNFTFNIY